MHQEQTATWKLVVALAVQVGALLAGCHAALVESPSGSPSIAQPMAGPFAQLIDYCHREEIDEAHCGADPTLVTACGKAAAESFHLREPFLEARVIFDGNAIEGNCLLALRTVVGWWVFSEGDDPSMGVGALHTRLDPGERYRSSVNDVLLSEDHRTVLLEGTFRHWNYAEDGALSSGRSCGDIGRARFEQWYTCFRQTIVCGIGASGKPSCAGPFDSGCTTYCRTGDARERLLSIPSPLDYQYRVRVEGHLLVRTPVQPSKRVGTVGAVQIHFP